MVGCGFISRIYFENSKRFNVFEITACADLDINRAKEKAMQYGILKAYSTEELIADPDIDLVLNLTIPSVHAEVAINALKSGKHVYGEKPLAVTRKRPTNYRNSRRERPYVKCTRYIFRRRLYKQPEN